MDERISYTREEVIAAGSTWPTRGLFCQECGSYIPVFEDLSEEDEQRVRQALQQHRVKAMKELVDVTGCSFEWAKLWALHGGKPTPSKETKPCPYCGPNVANSSRQTVPLLRARLHDEDNVVLSRDQP